MSLKNQNMKLKNNQNGPSLEFVERLRGRERVKFWSQPAPFRGFRLKGYPDFASSQVSYDKAGNIVRMPQMIGRPCFAQPSFYAREGEILFRLSRLGVPQKTRCGRCKVRETCFDANKKRLTADDDVKAAYLKFLAAGGADGLRQKHTKAMASVMYERLVSALLRHGDFTSVNDDYVDRYYDRKAEEDRKAEAARKAFQRRKKLKVGLLDDSALELIGRHRTYRHGLLVGLLKNKPVGLHPSIAKLPLDGAAVTADAWQAKAELEARQLPINASAVASLMKKNAPNRYQTTSQNALRQRVKNDLQRVARLERLPTPGRITPLWPPFDLFKEIEDEDG